MSLANSIRNMAIAVHNGEADPAGQPTTDNRQLSAPMHKHDDILMANGTSWHGQYIITTAARLTELFGEPTFDAPSCDGGQMEWTLEHDGMAITVYDRQSYSFDPHEPVRWHIGAHNCWNAMVACLHLKYLINEQTQVHPAIPDADDAPVL